MGANLKEVRERIKSVISTQQITKAMKMVSASKLRRAQNAIEQMKPYANKLDEMLMNILSNLDGDMASSFGEEREIEKCLIIPVTSNRGLCGGFNSNITKETIKLIKTKYPTQLAARNVTVLPIGKKAFESVRRDLKDVKFVEEHINLFSDLSFNNISEVASHIMDEFQDGTYDRIDVVYSSFVNAAVQEPVVVQFLPVPKIEVEGEIKTNADYIFEPSKAELLEHLIPNILKVSFQKFLLDTHASEHGARMTAMDKATENANDLLKDLRIHYNKARQEAITNEISEIVGGVAALEG